MKIAYGFFPSIHFSLSHSPTHSLLCKLIHFFCATIAEVGRFQWIFTVDPSRMFRMLSIAASFIHSMLGRVTDLRIRLSAIYSLFCPHIMDRTSHIYTNYISPRVKCISPCIAKLLLALGSQVIALTLCGNMLIKLD